MAIRKEIAHNACLPIRTSCLLFYFYFLRLGLYSVFHLLALILVSLSRQKPMWYVLLISKLQHSSREHCCHSNFLGWSIYTWPSPRHMFINTIHAVFLTAYVSRELHHFQVWKASLTFISFHLKPFVFKHCSQLMRKILKFRFKTWKRNLLW